MDNDLKYWVAVGSDIRIGARTLKKLAAKFGLMKNVWQAGMSDFYRNGFNEKLFLIIKEIRKKINPDETLANLAKLKISILRLGDKQYPKLLSEIPDAPELLYYKGDISNIEPAVAIVGSRKYTYYGKKAAQKLSYDLAKENITIVSGLALGIDAIAHQAALDAKGKTVAVIANGLDFIYPSTNRLLAEKILGSGGAIISEFPPKTQALRFNFPVRNRIIAGISLGTIIIEGAIKSGSLITAQCALEYNREVFAVPGDIFCQNSEGPNNLIKFGAKPVTSANDVIENLNLDIKIKHHQAKKILPDSREEAIILDILKNKEVLHVDKLSKLSKLNIATLNAKLTLMEIKGRVRNVGGNNYIKNF